MTEAPESLREIVLHEALRGLSANPKTLPPWLFYDERGSQLFEDITALPEYYLTRTERALFAQHANDVRRLIGAAVTVAELGAGSAAKTGILLREFAEHQDGLLYQPIDVSVTALQEAAASIAAQIAGVEVEPQVTNYVTERYNIKRLPDHAVLALYIGSSIGNFSRDEAIGILQNLRSHLQPHDTLLLGVDLAPGEHKSIDTLLAAYDDAVGVTAAFNKNVLVRLNRECNADFRLENFAHRARWNGAASRIEMHLESLCDQTIHVEETPFHFAKGETIHTESSYKFTDSGLHTLLERSGFKIVKTLQDDERRYAVVLAETALL
jgi:dimethylhistidine N-methyltransferase